MMFKQDVKDFVRGGGDFFDELNVVRVAIMKNPPKPESFLLP
jgi:hypothetical protein